MTHARGRGAETMHWPDHREMAPVKTTILEDDTVPKGATKLWVKEKEGKTASGMQTWWTDRSRTDGWPVGAAAMWFNGDCCMGFRSYLGTGRLEILDTEL